MEGWGLRGHCWRVYWVVAAVLIVRGAIIVGELRFLIREVELTSWAVD